MRVGHGIRRLRARIGPCTHPHDRYLLEDLIFPTLHSRPDMRRLLFVGCDVLTEHYPDFFADRVYITMDSDP